MLFSRPFLPYIKHNSDYAVCVGQNEGPVGEAVAAIVSQQYKPRNWKVGQSGARLTILSQVKKPDTLRFAQPAAVYIVLQPRNRHKM